MDRDEKVAVLFTENGKGEIRKSEITQEELGKIFFGEGNRNWDHVHLALPEPVWERIYEDGHLLYEGYTVNHKAFGAGRAFYRDGTVHLEGIFGLKGLLCGREYYSNGVIRFEGLFRLNQAYGPNYPEYGIWYDSKGKMLFRGKVKVGRSSLGWPSVYEPEGFGSVPDTVVRNGHMMMWEDARGLIRSKQGAEE